MRSENALGGERRFEGSLGTQVVKIFDLVAARIGIRDHGAVPAGYEPRTVAAAADDPQGPHASTSPRTKRLNFSQLSSRRKAAKWRRAGWRGG